jgi:hypothetical protein
MKNSNNSHFRHTLLFGGVVCDLTTNSIELTNLVGRNSAETEGAYSPHVTMKITVNEKLTGEIGRPHFRGMHHAAVASFGEGNIFLFDLLRKRVDGRVTGRVARDTQFWERQLLPITIGMLGACIGVLPMHAACAAIDGNGLLIAGESGAGKSTLSAALSQNGFDYLSDDWTFMNDTPGGLSAHGTSARIKLLPNAAIHFEQLAKEQIGESMNGELAYEVDVAKVFGASVITRCEPRWVVFLRRFRRPGSEFVRLQESASRIYLETSVERLPVQLTEAAEKRAKIIDCVSKLQCWQFQYGGSPQFAAELLREFVDWRMKEETA